MRGRRAFLVGLAGGSAAVLLSFAFRLLLGVTYLPEMAAQTLFSLTPGFLESRAVETLGPLAKESAFVGASVLLALILGAIPYLVERVGRMPEGPVPRFALFLLLPYAVMLLPGLVFIQVAQVSTQPSSLAALAMSLVPPSLLYGASTGYLLKVYPLTAPILTPRRARRREFERRRRFFMKTTVGAAAAAAILYFGLGLLFSKQTSQGSAAEADQILAAGVTPNSKFYRVDVNVIPPTVDSTTWTLKLHGLVTNPMSLTYDQLTALPSVQEYATLQCVSNQVGGDLMSTALWKGISLRDLLTRAGVQPDAGYVVFRCYDGYDVGIPLDRAMMPGSILAYQMNGENLPVEHGFPLRAIVPGLYGMMNAKWITEIEVVGGVYEGFWQRRGWTNIAKYQTAAILLSPGDSLLRDKFPVAPSFTNGPDGSTPIVGVAFAGDRGISKVEVSTDSGTSWQNASLVDPLSNYTWVFWKLEWNPPAAGSYKIMVRATDGQGKVQVSTMTDPFPNGATGYHVVDFRVDAPTG
ncbi:MAG: sulfite oxidase [Thaumarchaeota archaeon]|nr:sulfite oxidase [Nitrososphaerota archaeon]